MSILHLTIQKNTTSWYIIDVYIYMFIFLFFLVAKLKSSSWMITMVLKMKQKKIAVIFQLLILEKSSPKYHHHLSLTIPSSPFLYQDGISYSLKSEYIHYNCQNKYHESITLKMSIFTQKKKHFFTQKKNIPSLCDIGKFWT